MTNPEYTLAPVICMVTNRRRLGSNWETVLIARVVAAAGAGVHLIQIREPDLDARPLMSVVDRCVQAVRGTSTRVLVNDRVDVAVAAGAHGVHLRGDSVDAVRVREMVPREFIVGRSVHGVEEAVTVAAGGGLDYLVFGTVFATSSKPHGLAAGLDALAAVARATPLPVLAIGGVSLEHVGDLARQGAAGFAAIGLFADCPAEEIAGLVKAGARMFDTAGALS